MVWIQLNTMALISGRRDSNSGNQLEICFVSGSRTRLLRVSGTPHQDVITGDCISALPRRVIQPAIGSRSESEF